MKLVTLLSVALFGANAVRQRRSNRASTTKFIGGVPVLNYDLAYGGGSLSEEEKVGNEQKWVIFLKSKVTQAVRQKLCSTIKCSKQGDTIPFLEVIACEGGLRSFLLTRIMNRLAKYVEPESQAQETPEFKGQAAASWGLDRIGASKRANDGEGVHVYVLDTGVRATHGDFGGRVIPTLDMSSDSRVLCTAENAATCSEDGRGHGTHCAGSAAGSTYGVAPAATVHAVKVLATSGSGSWSWSYDALDYIATDGERPAIASMSLGGEGKLEAMGDSVDATVNAGVVVVVAGGNSNDNACKYSPAYVSSAITVGSTDSTDTRSYFSNYGACTDIWAPGSDIISASHASDDGSSTKSGTSMACPHVSGASALLLQTHTDWTADEVIEELLRTAIDGAISDMQRHDTNRLLYVGADAGSNPPAPVPTEPPSDETCKGWCPSFLCGRANCRGCPKCSGMLVEKSGKGGKGKGGKKSKAKADC
jgi:subtilisin family serine protease